MQVINHEHGLKAPIIRGTVRSAMDQASIVGAVVCLKPHNSIRSRLPDSLLFLTRTAADGSFKFDNTEVLSLLASTVGLEVTVMASGYAGSVHELHHRPRTSESVFDFVLEEGHTVSGIVTDIDGNGFPTPRSSRVP